MAQRLRTERFEDRDVVSQEIIVKFRGPANAEAAGRAVLAQDPDIAASDVVGRSGAVLLRSRGRSVAALMQAYARRPDVEYVEPNYVWQASDIPNDTFFGDQWALQNTGQGFEPGTPGADIEAIPAWDISEGSRDIVVAVIDSGIDYRHPDLIGNLWSAPSAFSVTIKGLTIQCPAGTHGVNVITRTCDPMDDEGHGTHMAGIIGASGNSGLGVSGVTRVGSMIAVKFLNSDGQGTTTDAVAAIDFAIQIRQRFPSAANVRVLNASWGGRTFSQALLGEINLAGASDMLFVTAAGNVANNNDLVPAFPAAYHAANLIAVAATDNRDEKLGFSSYGATTVDLGAPGDDIFSTRRDRSYGQESGTSASAAMVSGAAALVLSACGLDTQGLKSNLLNSVDPLPSLSGITVTGGRLNVNRAIRGCVGALPPTFTLAVSPAAQTMAFGSGSQFSITVAPLHGFAGVVSLFASSVPPGMSASFSPAELSSGGSSVLTVTSSAETPQGSYLIDIVAAGGGVTRRTGIVVTVGLPGTCTIGFVGSASGRLDTTDVASVHNPPALADYCTFTLEQSRAVELELSSGFDFPLLYLLSSSGVVLAQGTAFGDHVSRIRIELGPGTYTLEATSVPPGARGNYTLWTRNVSPQLTSMSPPSGMAGSTVDVTFQGTWFIGDPVTVKVSSCVGVTVADVNVISSTTVVATLILPPTVMTCSFAISTAGGSSSGQSFRVVPPPPTITSVLPASGVQGQTIDVTITGANFVSQVSVRLLDSNSNLVRLFSPDTLTPTQISFDWTVPLNIVPGQYRLRVQNEGGQSNEWNFPVLLAPPSITSIKPGGAGPGFSVDVSIIGAGFVAPVEIGVGPDITVTNVNIVSFSRIDATLSVASEAAFGDRALTVSTTLGTSPAVMFRVVPPPTVTSYTPKRAFLPKGLSPSTNFVTVIGTNFVCDMAAEVDGVGVTAWVVSCTETSLLLDVSVPRNAPLGPRQITLRGPNGAANPITIDIVPIPPLIDIVTPNYSAPGSTTTITITGLDLIGVTLNVSGTGVVATILNSTSFTLTASLAIAADAAPGPRELTVTNGNGVSDPKTFSVTPATWPDLTVDLSMPPEVAGGYEATVVVIIRNVGTSKTTAPISLKTDDFSADELVVTIDGVGWVCGIVIRSLACTNEVPLQVNAESVLRLGIMMSDGNGADSVTAQVNSPEDFNLTNNKDTASTSVSIVRPKIAVSHSFLQPGQQGTVSITLNEAFPNVFDDPLNMLTVSFTPKNPGNASDPALQFATGGRSVPWSTRGNTLVAELGGVSGPLGFQAGSVAGTLTFTVTIRTEAGVVRTASVNVPVESRPPTITAVTHEVTPSGFVAVITMLSSTREVSNLIFGFNTPTPIQLSCGDTPGCSVSGLFVIFNVAALFNQWYTSTTEYGTLATLRVPFNFSGSLSGTVSVSLNNRLGASELKSFSIP